MDPMNPQMSEQEQLMLGAQQAALLQQIEDKDMESKVMQQQHMIQEEQLLEAQHEAIAFQMTDPVEPHAPPLHPLIPSDVMLQSGVQQAQTPSTLSQPGSIQHPIPPPTLEGAAPQPMIGSTQPQLTQQQIVFASPAISETKIVPPAPGPPIQPPTSIGLPVSISGPPGTGPAPAMMGVPVQMPSMSQAQATPPASFQGTGPPGNIAGPPRLPPPILNQGQPPPNLPPPHIEPQVPPAQRMVPHEHQGPPPQRLPPPHIDQGPTPQRLPPPILDQRAPPPRLPPPHVDLGPAPQRLPPPHLDQRLPSPHIEQNQSSQRLPPPPHLDQGPPPQRMPPPQIIESGPPPGTKDEEPSTGSGPSANQTDASTKAPSSAAKEIKLPQALEKVLAFKGVRAQQMGAKPEDVERMEKGEIYEDEIDQDDDDTRPPPFEYSQMETKPTEVYQEDMSDDDEEVPTESTQTKKESKNKKRKKKKKRAKAKKLEKQILPSPVKEQNEEGIEIDYIQEEMELDKTDPSYREFSKIFQAFKIEETQEEAPKEAEVTAKKPEEVPIKARGLIEDDDDDEDGDKADDDDDKPKLSKKKQKKLNRLSVAELKQLVSRPDVVEMHDVTARDPKLLVHLKATKNTVRVPRHWCFKRKYLQGKRGIEKPPFDLPDFIKATGIMEMRQALQEKEDQKTMKSKMRERVRPKMGKIDIDYQKLHDAFFKWQTKPKLSIHGDLYYEGKEFETRLKEKKPGNLTDELRTALGMPIGLNADKYPPPWLIAMQRYGPPPSYPNLKVPGLNGPIPEGCAFGYHAGGWGKPPVDEAGKPLYGDVFGTQTTEVEAPVLDEDIDKTLWGELESESEEEEDSEEESEEEGEADNTGLVTPGDAGLITPSGVTSIPVGVETPELIELRKRRIEDAMDQGGDTPALYQVLPEKKTAVGGAMMGSAHVYDITAVTAGKKAPDKPPTEGVEIALNPDELDLDTAAMQAKYDQTMREQQSQLEKEDLSDMVAEHAAKQQKKRKKQQQEGKSSKKYKEFKF